MVTQTISLKTDTKTKNQIRKAAEGLGLSMNSFILMVAKQASSTPTITLYNPRAIKTSIAQEIEYDLQNDRNIVDFISKKDFFKYLTNKEER